MIDNNQTIYLSPSKLNLFQECPLKGKMLIPRPLDIEDIIKKVKKGKLITQEKIREILARKFKVKVTCPKLLLTFFYNFYFIFDVSNSVT